MQGGRAKRDRAVDSRNSTRLLIVNRMMAPKFGLNMRWLAVLAALVAVAAACGDAPLENVGDVSRRVVHGTSTTVTTEPEDVNLFSAALRDADEVLWVNRGIGDLETDIPNVVLNRVYERGEGINKFVQADPAEIIMVLPELSFPSEVPIDVEYVSSQLVFDVASGLLDAETAVAFGLWTAEPYSVDRRDGQAAVLRVSQTDPSVENDQKGIQQVAVPDGTSMNWTAREFSYELFCRDGMVDDRTCREIASSAIPLRIVYRDASAGLVTG